MRSSLMAPIGRPFADRPGPSRVGRQDPCLYPGIPVEPHRDCGTTAGHPRPVAPTVTSPTTATRRKNFFVFLISCFPYSRPPAIGGRGRRPGTSEFSCGDAETSRDLSQEALGVLPFAGDTRARFVRMRFLPLTSAPLLARPRLAAGRGGPMNTSFWLSQTRAFKRDRKRPALLSYEL